MGKEDYTMVSVPGKVGGSLDGMSVARLRQELEALRESEVCQSCSFWSLLRGVHAVCMGAGRCSSPMCDEGRGVGGGGMLGWNSVLTCMDNPPDRDGRGCPWMRKRRTSSSASASCRDGLLDDPDTCASVWAIYH